MIHNKTKVTTACNRQREFARSARTSRAFIAPSKQRASTVCAAHIDSCEGASVSRRAVLSALLLSGSALALPAPSPADETKLAELYDEILAYRFVYPVVGAAGTKLTMTLAHPPEKYSSAAPLTPDARQRIVSELIDLTKFVTVSVTVGPPAGTLKDAAPDTWKARDVAEMVLVDRSTSRVSSGQRVALNDIEDSRTEERNGQRFFVYEHISQGSPNLLAKDKETYRHALAVTTTRPAMDGTPYLYTLNLACPQQLWSELEPGFRAAIDSFTLTATTNNYVPPDKNPWMFF